MTENKIWSGRFKEKNDMLFEKMNRSLPFDIRLYKEDINLNKTYSKELNRIGLITDDELDAIHNGLNKIELEIKNKGMSLFANSNVEDIHMAIEELLTDFIGVSAKKIHAGKSRNDQVATDIRLYMLKEIDIIIDLLKDLLTSIVELAADNFDLMMPGFTHLRQAQPVLFSHYIMSFFFAFERDISRLKDLIKRVSIMPLGSGAISGSAYPLNRSSLQKGLGFDHISQNSIDGVTARDFIAEFLSDISILSLNLSRLAEDFIIYSSEKFNFFELSDKVTTGSSIMPNKKNPDSLELTRAKTGRIIGNFVAVCTVLKGLPTSYNKDLQEDKEPLFDTIDTIKEVIDVTTIMLNSIEINEKIMKKAIDSYSFATELADYLTINGIPFREAHEIVSVIVRESLDNSVKLTTLSESILCNYHERFKGIGDDWGTTEKLFEKRDLIGGTGKNSVQNQIEYARKILKEL